MKPSLRPVWAEVDLAAVRGNVQALLRAVTPVPVLAVVKADAYGHGAVEVANAATNAGASMLGVALVEEGIALREQGVAAEILLLSEPTADAASEFIGENVGLADGTSKETYTFRDGDVRDMTTRWTAVLEKEEGNWKISQIHFSANILDNPVLSAAQRAAGGNIFLPAGIGFALGALIIGLLGRKKTA